MAENECECPARKALYRLFHENEVPAKNGHYAETRAALSAPCPCEGLREKLSETIYSRDLAWEDKKRAQAEREEEKATRIKYQDIERELRDALQAAKRED